MPRSATVLLGVVIVAAIALRFLVPDAASVKPEAICYSEVIHDKQDRFGDIGACDALRGFRVVYQDTLRFNTTRPFFSHALGSPKVALRKGDVVYLRTTGTYRWTTDSSVPANLRTAGARGGARTWGPGLVGVPQRKQACGALLTVFSVGSTPGRSFGSKEPRGPYSDQYFLANHLAVRVPVNNAEMLFITNEPLVEQSWQDNAGYLTIWATVYRKDSR